MLYLHQPANVIPLGTHGIEFTPQITSLPYLPQIKGVFCYGLGEPQFAIDEYGRQAPPRSGAPFLVANGDLELADIDGGPVIVEDEFNPRDAYLILNNMDHISIVDEALRENPLSGHGPPGDGQHSIGTAVSGRAGLRQGRMRGSSRAGRRPSVRGRRQRRGRGLLGSAPPAGSIRAVSQRSTRPRAEQVEVVTAVAVAAVRVMVCPARDTPAVPDVPEFVHDTFGDSPDLRDQWLRWIQHP